MSQKSRQREYQRRYQRGMYWGDFRAWQQQGLLRYDTPASRERRALIDAKLERNLVLAGGHGIRQTGQWNMEEASFTLGEPMIMPTIPADSPDL